MNDDFDTLYTFISKRLPEVAGRGAENLPPELREKLSRFAAGVSTEEERRELKNLLMERSDLLAFLVAEVEALRQKQE